MKILLKVGGILVMPIEDQVDMSSYLTAWATNTFSARWEKFHQCKLDKTLGNVKISLLFHLLHMCNQVRMIMAHPILWDSWVTASTF